jgi:hypothetical protein
VATVNAAQGSKCTVIWAEDATSAMPARSFVLSQSESDQAKLFALFKRLADFGFISNREKFKKLDRDLWEFKSFQLRVLGDFRPNGIFVLAHGVRKKKDQLSSGDLQTARRILREHDERSERSKR